MTKISILLLFISLLNFSKAQSRIFGAWKASCPLERTSISSMSYCDLCPSLSKDNAMNVSNFEMNIDKNEMKIVMESETTSIKYKWDKETEALLFSFKNKNYEFKVLYTEFDQPLILKDKSGNILVLTKK